MITADTEGAAEAGPASCSGLGVIPGCSARCWSG